jgi:hypothetical protein
MPRRRFQVFITVCCQLLWRLFRDDSVFVLENTLLSENSGYIITKKEKCFKFPIGSKDIFWASITFEDD